MWLYYFVISFTVQQIMFTDIKEFLVYYFKVMLSYSCKKYIGYNIKVLSDNF